VVYWCNSYTIAHCSLDIIEWFKYKLKKVFKLYLILIHPPLSINTNEALASYLYNLAGAELRCLFNGRADFSFSVVITTLTYYGADFSFSLLQLGFDQSAKGDLFI
jgi:hypothetical protein